MARSSAAIECGTISCGDFSIPVIRSRRRTLALVINRSCEITMRIPVRLPLSYAQDFALREKRWIERARLKSETRLQEAAVLNCDHFLYFGKKVSFQGRSREKIAKALSTEALRYFQKLSREIAEIHQLPLSSVALTSAATRWGSCTGTRIRLSWRLIQAPEAVSRYVIAHELAHLIHKNHGVRFWRKVEVIFPSYKPARAWLRKNGHLLHSL